MAEHGPLSGQILGGKYLLGEPLGEGGFGTVYAGRHLLLDRPQAIKVLLEHFFRQPKFRERFLREARTVAALDHPHIVHIDDFGLEEHESRAYLVMPLLSGGTLNDLLTKQQQPLKTEQVTIYLEQICNALEYAHQRGVVHLDLKPHNLLVHEDGRLLLSDFGLAHLFKQEAVEGGTSLRYGTPHYMAPEHINGQPDQRSDVYALGVICYQMLTRRRPFEGRTPEAVMMKHLTEQPLPLQASWPEAPPELEEVVEKMLAKQAAHRYRTAGELLQAYKTALARTQARIRKVEEQRRKAAAEEQARKAEEARQKVAAQEQARRAEEARQQRIRQIHQAAYLASPRAGGVSPPRRPPRSLRTLAKNISITLIFILPALIHLALTALTFGTLGVLGFFTLSSMPWFHVDLAHGFFFLVVVLVGILLFFYPTRSSSGPIKPFFIYYLLLGLVCLSIGIASLLYQALYTHDSFLSLTHANVLDSIIYLTIGIPASFFSIISLLAE